MNTETDVRVSRFSPARVFVLILTVVFVVECGIMLVLPAGRALDSKAVALAVTDSVVLIALLCPALWLLVLRPLRSLSEERGRLLRATLTAQETERARLSGELHDGLGQAQTAVLLGLRAVASSGSLEEARSRAEGVHAIAAEAIETTRRIARGLSPTVLTDFGLTLAIERVCEDLSSATGVRIDRESTIGSDRFGGEIETVLYRVAQEALTNAVRHGDADTVRLRIGRDGPRITLEVIDDGVGIGAAGAAGEGIGVAGMRERVRTVGGEFSIRPGKRGGTVVTASVPATEVAP